MWRGRVVLQELRLSVSDGSESESKRYTDLPVAKPGLTIVRGARRARDEAVDSKASDNVLNCMSRCDLRVGRAANDKAALVRA